MPEPVGGSLRVAAMNTLNFFVTADYPTGDPLDNKCGSAQNVECRGWDSDQADEFNRQRTKLLSALSGLNGDIIGLNELENTTGTEPLESIVSGLAGYDYIHTGTIGTDAIKAGDVGKVTFGLGGDQGLSILADGYPKSVARDCGAAGSATGGEPASPGKKGLSYDTRKGVYTYSWATSESWKGTCRTFVLKLNDGSTHTAEFTFK